MLENESFGMKFLSELQCWYPIPVKERLEKANLQ
jgi:hypothetical protein